MHPFFNQHGLESARLFTNPHNVLQRLHVLQSSQTCFIVKTLGLIISPFFFMMTIPPSFIHPFVNQHGLKTVDIFVNSHESLQYFHTLKFIDGLQAPSSCPL